MSRADSQSGPPQGRVSPPNCLVPHITGFPIRHYRDSTLGDTATIILIPRAFWCHQDAGFSDPQDSPALQARCGYPFISPLKMITVVSGNSVSSAAHSASSVLSDSDRKFPPFSLIRYSSCPPSRSKGPRPLFPRFYRPPLGAPVESSL